ncbi:RNA polymerase sigma factor [Neolewinella persica]|uniref:RNA polymerase sigma factor n=1 Tax=Neolewinella persica TaxID=70998 RepID=UPI00036F8839|nr:RNA polymerase sigma factor [Neolewinella persica]
MPPPPNSSTTTIIAACKAGDRRAQEVFYRTYFPKLLPIPLRYLRNREEAVAVLNQGMLKIFQALEQYHEKEKLEAWLATIVRRTTLNFIRDEDRARRRFQPEPYDPPISVANTALGQLNAEDILKLLHALPDFLRIVFSLVVFDGYSHAEVATELEITVQASRWRLAKARELLRQRYQSINRINETLS